MTVLMAEAAGPTALGDALRQLRHRHGMTQKDLAQAAGIERSYLSMLESGGRRNASQEVLRALAGALGITTSELYRAAGMAWPEGEPVDDERIVRVDEPRKAVVLRRLAGWTSEQLERLERAARILLLEGQPPERKAVVS